MIWCDPWLSDLACEEVNLLSVPSSLMKMFSLERQFSTSPVPGFGWAVPIISANYLRPQRKVVCTQAI